jgi:hypothetical protein
MPSSAIRFFRYRAHKRELEVTFTTGRRYVYSNVPNELVEAFRDAESKGAYFNLHVRDRYGYRELSPEAT